MSEQNNTNVPLSFPRRHYRKIVALILGIVLAGVVAANWQTLGRYVGTSKTKHPHTSSIAIGPQEIKLDRPDALIESQHLSDLPKDLLKVPLLRDTLTEDFVFYYEANADRLGFAGSLRRIAYEHELNWQDSFITDRLNNPSTLGLWRSLDGKLTYGLLRIKIDGFTKISMFFMKAMALLSELAVDDPQLSKAADVKVGADTVSFYRLRYLGQKAVVFGYYNGYLLLASTPELLMDVSAGSEKLSAQAEAMMETFFTDDNLFSEEFNSKENTAKHRVSIKMSHLAMGYQSFFANLAAVSFELNGDQWTSYLGLKQGAMGKDFSFLPLWKAIPADAGLCIAVPLSAARIGDVIQQYAPDNQNLTQVSSALSGNLSACWFNDSHLLTPLFVAELVKNPQQIDIDLQLEELFSGIIGSYEANTTDGHFHVEKQDMPSGKLWTRLVSSKFGIYSTDQLVDEIADQVKVSEVAEGQLYFNVALAHQDNLILFSLDDHLVQHALDTVSKRYPALTEKIPADSLTLLYASPEKLAPLLERESMASLSPDYQTVFRNAAEKNLLPKVRAMKKYPDFVTQLPQNTQANASIEWIALRWKNL